MTFEIFVYRAQVFAVKLQNKQKGFLAPYLVAGGALITQFLMGLCFAKTLQQGEQQWRKQKSVKRANKK